MRTITSTVQLAVVLSAGLTPARSEASVAILSGNQLHEYCSASLEGAATEALKYMFCAGFIRGAYEQLWLDDVIRKSDGSTCLPESATNEQLIDIVKDWLKDNPGERHNFATTAVSTALNEAFPDCF